MKKEVNFNDPVIKKALELASAFSDHCAKNNLPNGTMLDGVAFNASALIEEARKEGYHEGVGYEQGRISHILGLRR